MAICTYPDPDYGFAADGVAGYGAAAVQPDGLGWGGGLSAVAVRSRRTAAAWSDAELVKGCLKGSEEAWEGLLERYQRLIYSIPVRMGLAPDVCADVFQSVCSILLEKLATLRDQALLSSWIVTTTRREALRVRRLAGRETQLPEAGESEGGQEAGLPSVDPAIEEGILSLELETKLRVGWARLDERCRQLLEALFFGPNEDYARLSKTLGMPVGSIGPTRMRCLRRLRQQLARLGL